MKFSYLFLAASVLCFCAPSFAADTPAGRGVSGTEQSAVAKAATDVANTGQNAQNLGQGLSNVAGSMNNTGTIDGALGGANSALGGINSSTEAIDKIFGGDTTGSIKGEVGALGDISKDLGEIGGMAGGVQNEVNALKQLANNPLQMLNLDMSQIMNIVVKAAKEQVMKLVLTKPSSGIPITSPGLQVQKTIEESIEKETSDIDKKIQEEKKKQAEAIGAIPATPAPQQTGVNNNDATAPQQNPSKDNCPAYMSQFPWATSIAYDVVKKNVLPNGKNSKYAPGQKTWDKAVAFVKSNFYAKDPQKVSFAEQKAIKKKRQEYFYEVTTNLITTSLLIQQGLVEDAKSISKAPTSGCNLIDDININTQTMMMVAKQTMADIALQARMLELEALQELNAQPITLRPEPVFQDPLAFLEKGAEKLTPDTQKNKAVNEAVQSEVKGK